MLSKDEIKLLKLNLKYIKTHLIIKTTILSITFIILFTSCIPIVELNKRGLVQSIGIDYNNKIFSVSFQIYNSTSSSGSNSSSDSKEGNNNIIVTSNGKTIADAMTKSCLKQDKKIYYKVTDVIILGKSIINNKQAFKQTINFLNKTYMSTPNVHIAICDKKASDIISAEIKQSITPSNFIQDMLKNAEKQSYIQKTYLSDIVTSLNNLNTSVSIPIITLQKSKDEKPEIKITGTNILHNGNSKGIIPVNKVKYLQLLNNKKHQNSFRIYNKKLGLCDFSVIKKRVKINPCIKNNLPHFNINLYVESNLVENTKGLNIHEITEQTIKNMEILQKKTLTQNISTLLNYLLKDCHADLLYFTDDIYKTNYNYWLKNKKNWENIIPQITFSLNVNTHIYRAMIERSEN